MDNENLRMYDNTVIKGKTAKDLIARRKDLSYTLNPSKQISEINENMTYKSNASRDENTGSIIGVTFTPK